MKTPRLKRKIEPFRRGPDGILSTISPTRAKQLLEEYNAASIWVAMTPSEKGTIMRIVEGTVSSQCRLSITEALELIAYGDKN